MLLKLSFVSVNYNLAVTDGNTTKVRPLRDWIKATYTNFESLVSRYKELQLKKLELKKKVAKHSEAIVDLVRTSKSISKEDISSKLKLDLEIVGEALKKSISSLMKVNKDKELKELTKEVKRIKLLKPLDFYENIIRE